MAESVIATPGGKFFLKEKIMSYFPPHECYIEIFGGAAHVLLAKPKLQIEIYNDLDRSLYCFFKMVREKNEEFFYKIETTPYSREMFNELKTIKPETEVDIAWRFYAINRMSFGAKRTGQTFGYGIVRRPAFYRIEKFYPLIKRLQDVTIENLDFREIISKYDGEDCFFYNDPPYDGSENMYSNVYMFSKKDHIDLAELLRGIKGKFLLSQADTDFIRELYKDFYMIEITRYNAISLTKDADRSTSKELLIANYNLFYYETPLFFKGGET